MNETGYAQSQGMLLLNRLVADVGPLFTIEQAQTVGDELSLSPRRVRGLLSQLAGTGWIERIKQGAYAVRAPLFSAELHPYAVAAMLVSSVAISHWSALTHHGFTTQIPPMIQASTSTNVVTPEMRQGAAYRPRGRAVWRALEWEFEFIRVLPGHFFGFQNIWVSQWHRVAITDPERTVLDLFAMPQIFGSLQTGLETLEAYLSRLNVEQLVDYALQYNVGAVIKRLGWALETLGVPEHLTTPLQIYPKSAYSQLDPTGPSGGEPLTRWQLRNNLRAEVPNAHR
ncbi:MAG: type IV toxin-antitoxin system AbiEi family antitoxin domain-containing protein [Anaerolineae bacterium]|nr:type IV toxin-antitoxin system AbiEi family antitoxin domain-containing protein [Anaerolineae bacterium]